MLDARLDLEASDRDLLQLVIRGLAAVETRR
jgi:hypothetical protein